MKTIISLHRVAVSNPVPTIRAVVYETSDGEVQERTVTDIIEVDVKNPTGGAEVFWNILENRINDDAEIVIGYDGRVKVDFGRARTIRGKLAKALGAMLSG